MRKYRNQPTVVAGIRFDSKKEANRDAELRLLVRAGEINNLERQPRFDLVVNGVKICTYVGDWRYHKKGPWVWTVEDAKGFKTKEFIIKWKLAKALYPEIEWRLS